MTSSLIRPSRMLAGTSLACIILAAPAVAQDATWLAAPGSASAVAGANWSTGTVPTGTAYFGASSTTALTVAGAQMFLGGWTFNANAAAYTFTVSEAVYFTGAGITVNGGSVGITNNFMLVFQNSSSAGSATVNNRNTIFFYDNSNAGSASFSNDGIYNQFMFFGTSSAGTSTISNSQMVMFSADSTASNASITNSGYLYFTGNSTAESAVISNSGRVIFSDFATGGNAQLNNTATGGSVDFTYSTGPLGDDKLALGSLAGVGVVYLGANQLAIGGSNLSTTFAGVISDCGASGVACSNQGATGGSLLKTGTGTLTLSGTNLYTGATTIDGGTLAVDGSIASSSGVTVLAGGALGGTGTVGNTLISGGTLAPGNSIGTLSVAGNLAFTSASTYLVEVSPTTADRTNVSGTATLGGATVNASFATGAYVVKQYTILTATGGLGGSTFGSVANTNLPSGFATSLSYDASNVYLNLTLNLAPSFGNGLSSNQAGVNNALTGYFDRNGGIPLAFGALTPTGLTQASGETSAGAQQPGFSAATQFVDTLSDSNAAGRSADVPAMGYAEEGDPVNAYASTGRKRSSSERDAYAAITKAVPRAPGFVPRWNVWVSGFGGAQTTDGNAAGGANTSTSRIGGVAVGVDYWLSPQTVAGFALAGGATNFSVAGSGSGRSDLFQVGGFVRHTIGSAYVTATAAYGWQNVSTDRMVGSEQLRAQFDTNSYTARLEGGNRFLTPWLGGIAITPYAAAQVTYLDLPAYAETAASGAGTFALAYAGRGIASPRTELGLRSDRSFAVSDALLILRGRAAWAHDFNTDRSASATFQSLPGASFVVNGARPAADAALTTAEAELRFVSGISVGATFEGEFSDVTQSLAGKGVVRYAW